MQKNNFIAKKIKKLILSINVSIESYFNKITFFINSFKKTSLIKNNKLVLSIAILVILTLSYFLIPTVYNKDSIKQEIKNQILNKYNINIKFNENITYSLLPRPHFISKNLSIIKGDNKIGNVKNFKIFISIDKLFFFKNFETRNLVLDKTDFDLNKKDLEFFYNLLKIPPSNNEIIIKNSNIFFKDKNNETLFINKISNSKFYYDSRNLENIFFSKNKLFNTPYTLTIKNDKFNKDLHLEFHSKKIRLNVDTKINYRDLIKKGSLEILFINRNTSLDYEISKNDLSFSSDGNSNNYDGFIDFKPFYLKTNINFQGLSVKDFFKQDTVLINLIRTGIFKNENLNANVNLKVNDITNIDELNNLLLKINFEDGKINLSNSNILWKEDLKINLSDSFVNYDENGVNLIGKMILDFKDLDNFYSSFQVNKNDRKKIKQIQLDFIFNFERQEVTFDNIKIDNKPNVNIQEFIDKFNSNKKKVFNKITFKNFVSDFFRSYAG